MPITKHGLSKAPEYRSWARMIHRCYFPQDNKFKYYGDRGVTVCERWRDSFEDFLADMGKKPSLKHTIDREDTNGNYEPGNCKWATYSQQNKNRRKFRVHTTKLTPEKVIAIRRDKRSKADIARQYGISGRQVLSIQRRDHWKHIP